MCGPTAAQSSIQQQQASFSKQLTQQASQVFGNSSSVFNDLIGTLAPMVAAGPSQEGFSAAEKSNLDSQAITETGVAYRNAAAAVGNTDSAIRGGNDPDVTGGMTTAKNLSVANAAAAQTSSDLSKINQADYTQGQQNYQNAVTGMMNAPSVFNPATSAAGTVTNAQAGAAKTANDIATQDNSWVQGVTGALGGLAGNVVTGGMKNLGSGVPFFGKNS